MRLKLSCYQLKIDNYNKIFYVNFKVTTKKYPLIDIQKINIKESKYITAIVIKSQRGHQERKMETKNNYQNGNSNYVL